MTRHPLGAHFENGETGSQVEAQWKQIPTMFYGYKLINSDKRHTVL